MKEVELLLMGKPFKNISINDQVIIFIPPMNMTSSINDLRETLFIHALRVTEIYQ